MQNINFWYSFEKIIRISAEKVSHITGEVYWPRTTFTPNSGKLEKKPLVYRQRQKNISLQDDPMPQNQDKKNCPWGLVDPRALPWELTKYFLFPYLINVFSFILFVGWICLETMKGLHISCSFNENFRKWKLFMKLNLGEGAGGNFTPILFFTK